MRMSRERTADDGGQRKGNAPGTDCRQIRGKSRRVRNPGASPGYVGGEMGAIEAGKKSRKSRGGAAREFRGGQRPQMREGKMGVPLQGAIRNGNQAGGETRMSVNPGPQTAFVVGRFVMFSDARGKPTPHNPRNASQAREPRTPFSVPCWPPHAFRRRSGRPPPPASLASSLRSVTGNDMRWSRSSGWRLPFVFRPKGRAMGKFPRQRGFLTLGCGVPFRRHSRAQKPFDCPNHRNAGQHPDGTRLAPESVRPLPSGQAAGLDACPPPARRRPPSHPAARSQASAAARPDEGQRNDLLCVGLARGLQNPAYAQRSVSLNCRPDVREPGAATLSPGTPPSGMKAPTRHRRLRPTRANMSRRPGNRSQHPLCDGGAGESSQAEDPRPKNPGLAGTSRAVPVPGRTRRRSPPSVGEERGRRSFRCASLRASRPCRAQKPIAPQPTCQRWGKGKSGTEPPHRGDEAKNSVIATRKPPP